MTYCFYFCIRENWLVKLTHGVVTNLKSRKRSTPICFKMKKKLMAWGDDLIRWECISTKSTNLVRWFRSTIMDCEKIITRISSKGSLSNLTCFNNLEIVIYLQWRLKSGWTSKCNIVISITCPWDLWMSQVQSIKL